VKPAPFTYHRPETRTEVDALKTELGSEAKILAGGQSLIPIMNMRLSTPEHLIDLNHLRDELAEPVLENAHVMVGPLVRQSSVERSALVNKHVPLLAQTMEYVAHPAIRNRGTAVGSIAHADPAAELPAVLAVLRGEVVARSSGGSRTIPAGDCFRGPLENSLEDTEWLDEVHWPVAGDDQGFAFEEFARRSGDYALCGVAATAKRTGSTTTVALGYLGMGDVPLCIDLPPLDAAALRSGEVEEAVAEVVEHQLDPGDDIHATVSFRTHLARRLGVKAARRAAADADARGAT
jgi:carbon-monoxide dehydrogenase medium subunit